MAPLSLSDDEVYLLIAEILSGERFSAADLGRGPEDVLLVQPSCTQRLFAEVIFRQSLKLSLEKGLISEKDLSPEIRERIFTEEDSKDLLEVEQKIKAYEFLLKKRVKGSEICKRETAALSEYKGRREALLSKKNLLDTYTAEYRAREDKLFYLLSVCVLNIDKSPRWESLDEMFKSTNRLGALYDLLGEFVNFYWGKDLTTLRYIARSGIWRNIFVGSMKGIVTLFGREAKDLSFDQSALLSWSLQYDAVYNMRPQDRPSDSIIEDDEKLDAYLDAFWRKREAEAALSREQKGTASDSEEVIVTAESARYVDFGKKDLYSDTALITSRVKDSNKPNYSEIDELKEAKKRRVSA